jgi:hypothetical protein
MSVLKKILDMDIEYLRREGARKELRAQAERKLTRIKNSADDAVTNSYTRLSIEILVMESCLSDLKKLDAALKDMGEEE